MVKNDRVDPYNSLLKKNPIPIIWVVSTPHIQQITNNQRLVSDFSSDALRKYLEIYLTRYIGCLVVWGCEVLQVLQGFPGKSPDLVRFELYVRIIVMSVSYVRIIVMSVS